jgi:hypothetical protein
MNDFPSKASRPRLRSIAVTAIAPSKYPQFGKDRDHLFMRMEEGARTKEVVEIFAHVHVQRTLDLRSAKRPSKMAKAG